MTLLREPSTKPPGRRTVSAELADDLVARLDEKAARLGVSRSWLVARLVEEGIERVPDELPLRRRSKPVRLPSPPPHGGLLDPATCDVPCGYKGKPCFCGPAGSERRQAKTAARDDEIERRFLDGESARTIAVSLGLYPGHAAWVLRQRGYDPRAAWRARLAARGDRNERARARTAEKHAQEAAERLAEGKTCRLCGAPNPRREQTCSTRCAKGWIVLRFWLDDELYERHRRTRARTVVGHPDRYKPHVVEHARRLLAGEDVPPNRFFFVPGRKVQTVAEEFGIDLGEILERRRKKTGPKARPWSSLRGTMEA